MKFHEKIGLLANAGYPCIWINTLEPDRLVTELINTGYNIFQWDCIRGLIQSHPASKQIDEIKNPKAMLEYIANLPQKTLLIMHDMNKCLQDVPIYRLFWHILKFCKSSNIHIICIGPYECHDILKDDIIYVDFPLPDEPSLQNIANTLIKSNQKSIKEAGILITQEQITQIVKLGRGMTSQAFEAAISYSLVRTKTLDPSIVVEQKAQMILQSGLIYGEYTEKFADIGGLENLKNFTGQTVNSPLSLGCLLLGPPGTGKSMLAKALGNEAKLPTLILKLGKMFSKWVGESYKNIEHALQIVEAMSPCVLMVDEIEKAISGIQSSGETDGGTTSRTVGEFLTWLSDRTKKVYVIATCNNIDKMPPEFLRAERWDAIFFVDLPQDQERIAICKIYQKQFNNPKFPEFNIDGFSGAEIKSLYRTGAMFNNDLNKAREFVIPISVSRKEEIQALRKWAENKTIPAGKINIAQSPARYLHIN